MFGDQGTRKRFREHSGSQDVKARDVVANRVFLRSASRRIWKV